MFTDMKSIFVSKTIWGIGANMGLKAAALALAYFGYEFDEGAQKELLDLTTPVVLLLISFGPDAYAVWGRIVATKQLV